MNIFSRSIVCALLLGGTTQPIDWKYVFPLTVVGACFGGGISWAMLSMQNKNKIEQLTKDHQDKETQNKEKIDEYEDKIKQLNKTIAVKESEIWNLQSETGSMRRKKGQLKESNQDQELTVLLRKELEIQNTKMKKLEDQLADRNEFYNNYSPLISAIDIVGDQAYLLHVEELNQKVSFGIKIDNEIFDLIEQAKFYIPRGALVNAKIAMWQAQRGDTIKMSNKGRTSKTRLPPPLVPSSDTAIIPPPLTSTTSTTPTSTPSGSLREKNPNRVSINPENTQKEIQFLRNLNT